MHYKYTYSYHHLQEKIKNKKFFKKNGKWNQRNFSKKIFRKGNPIPSSGVLGGWYTHTPLHHNDNTLRRHRRHRRHRSVYCLLVKNTVICVFKVLFTGLYAFYSVIMPICVFKRLKWALFCFMLIQKDYKYGTSFRWGHSLELFKIKPFASY